MKPESKGNFADGKGYKVPVFARPLLNVLPSFHLKDQPASFHTLAGPYNATEYQSALKTIAEYSRANRTLAMVYTRTLIYICEDKSRELLSVEAPSFPSSPVQSPVIPGPSVSFALAPYIVPLLPPHHCFVDLLGSRASVLMLKPRSISEIYNDRRDEIANLFEVLRKHGPALASLLALTPYQPGKPRENAAADHADPVERARRTVLRLAQVQNRADWRSYQNALPGIADRLRDLEVTSEPAPDLAAKHDRPGVHFHLDFEGWVSGKISAPVPEIAPLLPNLKRASVSILADSPFNLPFPSKSHPLPESKLFLTVGDAQETFRKRTKETRLPKDHKIKTGNSRPTTRARAHQIKTEAAEIRHRLNISQRDFADLLGVPHHTVRGWERGGKISRPGLTLLKIAKTRPEVLREIHH